MFLNARKLTIQFLVSGIGIILIGALPQLFGRTGDYINPAGYVESVKRIVDNLLHLNEMTYNVRGTLRPLFPTIFEPFLMSMTLLVGALLLAVIVSSILTYLTMLMHKKGIEIVKFMIFIFESIPDILIIISLQVLVIFIFKQTGILVFSIASMPGEKAIALPLLTLSILPMVQLYKLMILIFEEELEKQYVEMAKGKGLRNSAILLIHIFRNAGISIFHHSKSILWFMLSNLFVLEYLFNIYGITQFMIEYLTPEIFTVGLFMFFIPLYFLYLFGDMVVSKLDKGSNA